MSLGVIPTLAVDYRQGRGLRMHRQQAGGASMGDRGGTAVVRNRKPLVSRRFPAALGNPPRRRCLQRRHGDSDPLTAILFLAVFPARNRMAVTGVVGPLGAPAVPMPMA
ncbi:hypothetical protein NDU88_005623 [Pleurodeles waltl]|uniref:Uncharacterized protein n=1 Tax=Pleurodeles waltl TaxID=8319 RepID=A0AAV7SM75_PLEWA|nr:hypothetical protein NDU88_005623 [Pleurodeles waltl]